METITVNELRDRLDEVLEKVKNGQSLLITDNGHVLAELVPVAKPDKQKAPYSPSIRTKEEFDARMAELDKAFAEGRLSVKDSYFANVEEVDMGPTDSSNLDAEIYR